MPIDYTMAQVVEAVRSFFYQHYELGVLQQIAVSSQEQASQLKDASPGLPQMLPPVLGLVVGGFDRASYQSELWNIQFPYNSQPETSRCSLSKGQYASAWFAAMAPIHRYVKGIDPNSLQRIVDYLNEIRAPLNPQELEELKKRANSAEFTFVFPGMPIAKGVEYVRFLIDLVIGHHKFAAGDAIVGGRCRVGYVTFEKGPFRLVEDWRKES